MDGDRINIYTKDCVRENGHDKHSNGTAHLNSGVWQIAKRCSLAATRRLSLQAGSLFRQAVRKMATDQGVDRIDIDAIDAHEVYSKAEEYWAQAPRDNDGMLGGFAELHKPDLKDSRALLTLLHKRGDIRDNAYALDCGAGIGRVTKHLLLPIFKKVDMVELVQELVDKSKDYIGPHPSMGERFVSGLQDFTPETGKYDLIWIQWVSGHLTNSDFVAFFKRCQDGLRPNGIICLKDNIASGSEAVFDSEDHSWTRPELLVDRLMDEAGLRIVTKQPQMGFPKGMYKVLMYAVKPKPSVPEKRKKEEESPKESKANLPTLI